MCVKILERRSLLLGLDAPTKVDVVQLQVQQAPSNYEKIREAVFRLARGPDWKPNGDAGAVDMLSSSDCSKPSD